MKKKKLLCGKRLSREQLADLTAGATDISIGDDQCPFWDTCPHRYPGCYQPQQKVLAEGCGLAAVA